MTNDTPLHAEDDKMTRDAPLVSVIIPSLDRREALERCLDALERQTLSDFETIVVDDGSRDGTSEMLADRHLSARGVRLRTMRHDSPQGANAARNAAMSVAAAPLLAFLDSDCRPEPAWLEQLTAPLSDGAVAAVCGNVIDVPPRNLHERALRGTHRVTYGAARRIIAGNLCLRRSALRDFTWDQDVAAVCGGEIARADTRVSGRCDEEGLSLRLREKGLQIRCATEAIVHHDHHHDRRSFFRQAFRGGRSAATLVWKYRLATRIDLLPFLLGHGALLALAPWYFAVSGWLLLVPAGLVAAGLAAIMENELLRKGKSPIEMLRTLPLILAYQHVRLTGYVMQSLRLRIQRRDAGQRVRLERPLRE